jgi:hypothetical protein
LSGQTKPENEEKGGEEEAGLAFFIVSLGGVLALMGAVPESSVQTLFPVRNRTTSKH